MDSGFCSLKIFTMPEMTLLPVKMPLAASMAGLHQEIINHKVGSVVAAVAAVSVHCARFHVVITSPDQPTETSLILPY